jgi:tetratricopeptide (TPR) repeat protein
LDPNSGSACNDLGGVLAALGRLEDAADAYQRAVRLNPDLYEAHFALGQILERTGDVLNARTHYEKAAQSPDPSVQDAARKALRYTLLLLARPSLHVTPTSPHLYDGAWHPADSGPLE